MLTKLRKMCRKEHSTASFYQLLRHGKGEGQSFFGRSSAAKLVNDHQAVFCNLPIRTVRY